MNVKNHEEQGVQVYEVAGNLNGYPDCYAFLDNVRSAISGGAGKVLVDLEGVEKMDSAGVGILASIVNSADSAGAALRFSGLSARTEKPIIVVGLMRVMQVSPTVEAALKEMSAG